LLPGTSFLEDGKKFGFGKRSGITGTVLETKGVTGLPIWEGGEQNRP